MSTSTFDLDQARSVAAPHLQPEHVGEFRRLAKGIVHGSPFQLLFIDCADSIYRDRVIDSLGDLLNEARLRVSRLPIGAGLRDAAAFERRLRQRAANADVVHVLGSRAWFNTERWDKLNLRRERLASGARARLLFWLDADSIAQLAQHAPDLWAWRGGVYEFALQPPALAVAPVVAGDAPVLQQPVPDSRSLAARRRRVVELQRMLSSKPPPIDELCVPLVNELGLLLLNLGELDQALALWHEVELPLLRRGRDERAIAISMGKIADVLASRGQIQQALQIRIEQEWPVYERVGAWRELLQCAIKMAATLKARHGPGDLGEARRHLRSALARTGPLAVPEIELAGQQLAGIDLDIASDACHPAADTTAQTNPNLRAE